MLNNSIAIVGMACRLPGGVVDGPSFRQLLSDGIEAVSRIPPDRWDLDRGFHPTPGEPGCTYTWAAGVLDGDPRGFDAAFFGISPREATLIDPQQRLATELAWEALEDAGIRPGDLRGGQTGVAMGVTSHDWSDLLLFDSGISDFSFMTGVSTSIVAARISHLFDLRGPSLSLDSACSSGLMAVDLACRWLREGEASLVLTGGVNLLLAPFLFRGLAAARMLSPTHRCRAFDARADGYVRGEGGVVFVLQRLEDALGQDNRILGVIRGMATGNDGWTPGMALPSAEAQEAVIREAMERAEVEADDVSYVEAHGTGTPAGDALEAEGLGAALGSRRLNPLPIGSVKTNIGHLEAAAGVSGLAKALLVLSSGEIPPSLNFRAAHPSIDLEKLNLEVVTTRRKILKTSPVVGISSFGFGGTGGHLILEAPPAGKVRDRCSSRTSTMVLVSSRSPLSLERREEQIVRILKECPSKMSAVASTLAHHREHLEHRTAWWHKSVSPGQRRENRPVTGRVLEHRGVAFAFCGNGSQWAGMGQTLLSESPVFHRAIEEVDAKFQELGSLRILEIIKGTGSWDLRATEVAQPALLAFQVGLVRMLEAQGLTPNVVIGHSVGEMVAAWAAGVLTLDETVRAIDLRSRVQGTTRHAGTMAAVALGWEVVEDLATRLGLAVELSGLNAPGAVTVAGPEEDLARLVEQVRLEGGQATVLELDYAFHSSAMDLCREPLLDGLQYLEPKRCRVPLLSTVTGNLIEGPELGAEHWWLNTRQPVRFEEAVGRLPGLDVGIVVEIGPRPVLGGYLRRLLGGRDEAAIIPTVSPDDDGAEAVTVAVAGAWVHGARIDPADLAPVMMPLVSLPPYPWDHEINAPVPSEERLQDVTQALDHPLLGLRDVGSSSLWRSVLDPRVTPWLGEHRIGGRPVLPGTGLVEIALATCGDRSRTVVIEDLALLEFLGLEDDAGTTVETHIEPVTGRMEIRFRRRLSDRPWTVAARGWVVEDPPDRPDWRDQFEALGAGIQPVADPREQVDLLESLGMEFGPAFRAARRIAIAGNKLRVDLEDLEALADQSAGYLVHPCLLDACLQSGVRLLHDEGARSLDLMVPVRFRRVRHFPGGGAAASAIVCLKERGERYAVLELRVVDREGRAILEIGECRLEPTPIVRPAVALPFTIEALAPSGAEPLDMPQSALLEAIQRVSGAEDSRAEEAHSLLENYLHLSAHRILEESARSTTMTPVVKALASRLGEALVAAGLAGPGDDDGYELFEVSSDLPDALTVWRTLLWQYPERSATAILALEAVQRLEGTLLGARPIEPDAEAAADAQRVLEGVLEVGRCVETLTAVVKAVAEHHGAGPPRVFELEAGHGIVTRSLVSLAEDEQILLTVDGADMTLEWEGRRWPWTAVIAGEDDRSGGSFEVVAAGPRACGALEIGGLLARSSEALVPGGILVAFGLPSLWPWGPVAIAALGWHGLDQVRWRQEVRAAGLEPIETGLESLPGLTVFLAKKPVQAQASDAVMGQDGVRPEVLVDIGGDGEWASALESALSDVGATVSGSVGVDSHVVLVSAPGPPGDEISEGVSRALTALGRALSGPALRAGTISWVIPNGRAVSGDRGDDRVRAVQEALWAAGRVMVHERPAVRVRLLDVAGWGTREEWARTTAEEVLRGGGEPEIVLRPGRRLVPCLVPYQPGLMKMSEPNEGIRFDVSVSGGRPTPRWIRTERAAPGPGEVEIRVKASGLNFRDAMLAVGMLPGEALEIGMAGEKFGMECAGVVERVGDEVRKLTVGQTVMALGSGTLASFVTLDAGLVVPFPDGVGPEVAAGMAVVGLTVAYALDEVAGLGEGEWVLIHGGAGGIGLAAIQHAMTRGARIIATAGTPARRRLLRAVGVDHAFDSRSGRFVSETLRVTGGRGVDVVLNALSGELLERSMGLLAPFGRFVELGKRDVFGDRTVGLYPLRHNNSLTVVDSDSLASFRPETARRILDEMADRMQGNQCHPVPYRVFSAARTAEALALMRRGGHVGKLIIDLERSVTIPQSTTIGPVERAAASGRACLIVGGMGGIGFETARWLLARGVETVVLAGRSAPSPVAHRRIEEVRGQGIRIEPVALDVRNRTEVQNLVARFGRDFPALGGVIHAAAVFEDRLLTDIDPESVLSVMQPKAEGAWLLDETVRAEGIDLDFFVLLSSAVTGVGNHGQGAYAAANASIERLAVVRRDRGDHALAVALGPVTGVGLLERAPDLAENLERKLGGRLLEVTDVIAGIDELLRTGAPPVVCLMAAEIAWGSYGNRAPAAVRARLAPLMRGCDGPQNEAGDITALLGLEPEEGLVALTEVLRRLAGRILQVDPEKIDPNISLAQQGMDSLTAAEFQVELVAFLGGGQRTVAMTGAVSVAGMAREIMGLAAAGDGGERRTIFERHGERETSE